MRQKGFSIARLLKAKTRDEAQGRLGERQPIAVIDIGSNSVRQVVYEGLTRAPSILFNEKVLCGLGRGVARNNRLDEDAAERALKAITRFRQVGQQLRVDQTHVLATAASRDAENGPEFIARVEEITGVSVNLLSGREEAEYACLGIKSSFYKPEGIAGDLGGGSVELIEVNGDFANGVTTPLGSLRLAEKSGGDLEKAAFIVRETLKGIDLSWPGQSRTFYAIGGTWRSLARLQMLEAGHPAQVIHGYTVDAETCVKFCNSLVSGDIEDNPHIGSVSKNRRALLPFGAVVMAEIIERLGVKQVSMSGAGLRDGFMFSLLDAETRGQDALLEATAELSILRARSPRHCRELAKWTDAAMKTLGVVETENQRRWRLASCNLADIVWRSSSDFRASQTLGIINNAGFTSISHEGRAYLALVTFHRYQGFRAKLELPEITSLASEETTRIARITAAFFRLLYLFSAGEADTLPSIEFIRSEVGALLLKVPDSLMDLLGEKTENRLSQLIAEVGEEISVINGE